MKKVEEEEEEKKEEEEERQRGTERREGREGYAGEYRGI